MRGKSRPYAERVARDPEYREKHRIRQAEWRKNNRERTREIGNRSILKKRYGITPEERDELLRAQGYRCAACGTRTPRSKRKWHVDHCHRRGSVRAILCLHCNVVLGHVRDRASHLEKLIKYLKETRGKRNPIHSTRNLRRVHAERRVHPVDSRAGRKRKNNGVPDGAVPPRVRARTRS